MNDIKKFEHYMADYINEELDRKREVTSETINNAIGAFEGGAFEDGQGYIVHIAPDDQTTRPILKAALREAEGGKTIQKFYIGHIEERNGEREYSQTVRFRAKDEDHAFEVLDAIASTWYGEPDEREGDSGKYWFSCGEVVVYAGNLMEVSESTYEKTSRIFAELKGTGHGE